MTVNMEAFQVLLAGMRADFLAELPERCDGFEELILILEKLPSDREAFNTLYRCVHSLKGSGGTHGLTMITTLCHQLEDLLSEAEDRHGFDADFASRALSLVDLLRQVGRVERQPKPDYSAIEAELDAQRRLALQNRKSVMIAESSKMMAGLYQTVLEAQPLQLTVVDEGLVALERLLNEPFDLVIAGRELKTLNGIALTAALRASQSRNRGVPVLLVSSSQQAIPAHVGVSAVIARDRHLSGRLLSEVRAILEM